MPRRTAIFLFIVLAALGLVLFAALNPATGKSRSAGILPALDIYRWVARPWGPFAAAGIMILADYGAIRLIRGLVEQDWSEPKYWTFRYNDRFCIPLMIIGIGFMLRAWKPSAWYTKPSWHLGLLCLGLAVSLFIERGEVAKGTFTMAQEYSPSKAWHTVIFAVVFYWLAVAIVPLLVTHRPWWAVVLILVGLLGFVRMANLDGARPMIPEVNGKRIGDHRIYNYKTGESYVRTE